MKIQRLGGILIALIAWGAFAAEPLPMPGPLEQVEPASGHLVHVESITDADDRSLYLEAGHPPFDQIPPMPMPEPGNGQSSGRSDDSATFHDALTGETEVWPASGTPSGLAFDHSPEPTYEGIGPRDRVPVAEGFGTMTVASSLTGWPRRGNVKLFMRFTDTGGTVRWFTCSGSMADAGVVQTAAHCVYARNPNSINIFAWAEIIYIYPAWDGTGTEWAVPGSGEVIQNYGYLYGTNYLAGTNYINNGDFDSDVGLIAVTRGGSRMAGVLTGWFGWAWGGDCATLQARTYHNFSYPSESCGGGLHTGRTMYYWSGSWDSCPGNQLSITTTAGCLTALWGGMSGSGAYYIDGDNRFVHAVASNSNRSTYGAYAKLWEQWITDRTTFTNNTRGSTFDLEALQFRTTAATTVTAGTTMSADSSVLIANATNAAPGPSTYTLRIYLSTNNIISFGDTLLAVWNYNTDFAAMQVRTFIIPAIPIPAATPAGNYWLGAILDPATDSVASNNDSSTWDALAITVQGTGLFADGFE